MLNFIREGGFGMLFIILFGLATLVVAVLYVLWPDERKVAVVRALSTTTVFASLVGITSGLAAVFHKVPNHPVWSKSPDLALIVMTGIGESLNNAVLGFALLALSWLMVAVGSRRAPHLS